MGRSTTLVAVVALSAALAAAGCTTNSGSYAARPNQTLAGNITLAQNSNGPAPAEPGAKSGGTLYVLGTDPQVLDPARIGGTSQIWIDSMLTRTLTAITETGDGRRVIAGDLATDTGQSSDSGRVWKYTLKQGLRYQDGSPVTAADIGHGIARMFAPELAGGLTYLQKALAGSADYAGYYRGPYDGGAPLPPGVQTPDQRTIILKFPRPQPYMPFMGRWVTPVPAAKDGGITYDDHLLATGPYEIQSWDRETVLTMVRNPQWDPKTDPIRHQYPERVVLDGRPSADDADQRLIADAGPDQTAIAGAQQVAPELMSTVAGNAALQGRIIQGQTGGVDYLYINNQRVTDLKVRQALNYAIDRQSLIKALGGPLAADPATTVISPTDAGYRDYNAYNGGPTGDPAKARALLGDRTVPLTLAVSSSPLSQQVAVVLKAGLERAGFRINLQLVPGSQYNTAISTSGNPFDLYTGGWLPAWPDGQQFIEPLLAGSSITARGNFNWTFFNNPRVNAQIDRIDGESDANQAAQDWGALDETIMRDDAPLIPAFYTRVYQLHGSKVGGALLDPSLGYPVFYNLFLK